MITAPRYKVAKRLGPSVFEKTQGQKFAIAAERSARAKKRGRGGRLSEYGKQMLEKQKVRVTYGVTEKQFRTYVKKALEGAGNPLEKLHAALELRLDNVTWRLGLASTRRAARQFVAHGHLFVNGKRISSPSYEVKLADALSVREGSKAHGALAGFAERSAQNTLPAWLVWDTTKMAGKVASAPTAAATGTAGDLSAVLSFYTR